MTGRMNQAALGMPIISTIEFYDLIELNCMIDYIKGDVERALFRLPLC